MYAVHVVFKVTHCKIVVYIRLIPSSEAIMVIKVILWRLMILFSGMLPLISSWRMWNDLLIARIEAET